MKILLDTHLLVWYFSDDAKLSTEARKLIEDDENEVHYSILSVMEVEIKHAAHPDKLSLSGESFVEYCNKLGFVQTPLDVKHILEIKKLTRKENTPPHRDPFDRLMLCQAIVEDMLFITHDARIAEYVVTPMVLKI